VNFACDCSSRYDCKHIVYSACIDKRLVRCNILIITLYTPGWSTYRFNHIVVDRVKVVLNSVRRVMDVVFMSTFEGVIYKYVILRPSSTSSGADSEACLIERIKVTPIHQTVASLTLDERNVSRLQLLDSFVFMRRSH